MKCKSVTCKAVGENICPHSQGLLTFFLWVVVDALVFPAIAKIAFKRIENY